LAFVRFLDLLDYNARVGMDFSLADELQNSAEEDYQVPLDIEAMDANEVGASLNCQFSLSLFCTFVAWLTRYYYSYCRYYYGGIIGYSRARSLRHFEELAQVGASSPFSSPARAY
jgi:hypothetical protein